MKPKPDVASKVLADARFPNLRVWMLRTGPSTYVCCSDKDGTTLFISAPINVPKKSKKVTK